ncbi:N-acetylmuramoyl-L-alanine amidase family protein [Cesiribacter andamanensis]|uniref:N-acetylmuramoyl-L-alanine amidase n=1 Tax=Cesiribacter andamanensis AMV16 TaxID=1279009 RepID=M7NRZ5_9BACT|nr:N-acetylmuramoyl-L-alanine amidase [Cesiribacter andamanensis]EMR01244.1 N-acetylmuramoyl-L-alanine amidase CwlD [Cesiribacter andamanensis AMV16]
MVSTAVRTPFLLLLLLCLATPLLAQETHPTATAERGDGIYTLLRKHGLDPAQYLKPFVALNRDKLGKDSSLHVGRTYLLPLAPTAPDELLTANAGPGGAEKSAPAAPVSPAGSATATGGMGTGPTPTSPSPASPAPAVPKETGILDVPLFGKKYSRVEVRDTQLKGAVYYLTAGHGGPDPGAIGKYGPYHLSEDEYAYDVTIRLARRLMEHGATVYMIIQDPDDGIRDDAILLSDKDEICYPGDPIPLSQKERLRQRTNAVNGLYLKHRGAYQRMLAIHVDSRSQGQNIDVFFYHHENSPHGAKLASTIHQTFTNKYSRHQPNRNYHGSVSTRSSLYVIKYSHPPAVFIELGNIKNDLDQRRFVLPDNRQALANWICDGIISDYKAQ